MVDGAGGRSNSFLVTRPLSRTETKSNQTATYVAQVHAGLTAYGRRCTAAAVDGVPPDTVHLLIGSPTLHSRFNIADNTSLRLWRHGTCAQQVGVALQQQPCRPANARSHQHTTPCRSCSWLVVPLVHARLVIDSATCMSNRQHCAI